MEVNQNIEGHVTGMPLGKVDAPDYHMAVSSSSYPIYLDQNVETDFALGLWNVSGGVLIRSHANLCQYSSAGPDLFPLRDDVN